MTNKLKLFTGNSNKELAEKMADYLGITLGDAEVYNFSDGETFININENVRGCDIFLMQSTSNPVDKNLMELQSLNILLGWGGRIRTSECRNQNPVTCRLSTPQCIFAN